MSLEQKLRCIIREEIQYILYESNVKDIYKQLRKSTSFKNKRFLYYLIKTYGDVGYNDNLKNFKKYYDDVMAYVKKNTNLQRIIKQNNIETDLTQLQLWNDDK